MYYVSELWLVESMDTDSVDMEGLLWDLSIHRFWYQRQVLETNPSQIPKDDCINLKKHIPDLYTKNLKMLMKEIKNDLYKWRDNRVGGLEDSK